MYYSKDEDNCVQLPFTSIAPSQSPTVAVQNMTVSTSISSLAKRTPSTFSTGTLPAVSSLSGTSSGTSSHGTVSTGRASSVPPSTRTVLSETFSNGSSTTDSFNVLTKGFSGICETEFIYCNGKIKNFIELVSYLASRGLQDKVIFTTMLPSEM